jgi:hypothetical protein
MVNNLIDQSYSDAFACALARIDRLGPNRRLIFTVPTIDGDGLQNVAAKLIIPAQILPTIVNLLVREIYDAPGETDEKVAVVRGELRHQTNRARREGEPARCVPDYPSGPGCPVRLAGPAPRIRVHLCRNLRQQAAQPGEGPAVSADVQRRQIDLAAYARYRRPHRFPFPRLPPRFRNQAFTRQWQLEAGPKGDESSRYQIDAALRARARRRCGGGCRAARRIPEKVPDNSAEGDLTCWQI